MAALTFLPVFAFAANYDAGSYGGGDYGQGTAEAPPAATNSGGGGVISGPLSVGYVNTALVVVSTTSVVIASTSAANNPPPDPATANVPVFQFTRSLQFRDAYPDVLRLQQFLNTHGAPVALDGAGSSGSETTYFGPLTFAALIRFQDAHADEILKPAGLTAGTGYFGPATRAFVNRTQN